MRRKFSIFKPLVTRTLDTEQEGLGKDSRRATIVGELYVRRSTSTKRQVTHLHPSVDDYAIERLSSITKRGLLRALRLLFISVVKYFSDARDRV